VAKEIVHLSYKRTEVTPEQKGWQIDAYCFARKDPQSGLSVTGHHGAAPALYSLK
jgi:hypothetical protein